MASIPTHGKREPISVIGRWRSSCDRVRIMMEPHAAAFLQHWSLYATAAQNPSNALGVKIMVQTERVWAKPNGVLGAPPKPYGKAGEWKDFRPGGDW